MLIFLPFVVEAAEFPLSFLVDSLAI